MSFSFWSLYCLCSSIYGFRLHIWYLQIFLITSTNQILPRQHYLPCFGHYFHHRSLSTGHPLHSMVPSVLHLYIYVPLHRLVFDKSSFGEIRNKFISNIFIKCKTSSLFVLLYIFFWPLCCLFFFDLRTLNTPWYLQSLRSSTKQWILQENGGYHIVRIVPNQSNQYECMTNIQRKSKVVSTLCNQLIFQFVAKRFQTYTQLLGTHRICACIF